MPVIISTATTANRLLGTDDLIYVTASGSIITTTNAPTIQSTLAAPALSSTIVIDGLVAHMPNSGVVPSAAISLAFVEGASGNNVIEIGATGTLRSEGQGIDSDATVNITNHGLISAKSSAITLARGGSVDNFGHIDGNLGILARGNAAFVTNAGTISSTSFGVILDVGQGSVVNTGDILSRDDGVVFLNGQLSLDNLGTITALDDGVAISALSGGTVSNLGSIIAKDNGVTVSDTNGFALQNQGTIQSGGTGVDLSFTAFCSLVNSGSISFLFEGFRVQDSSNTSITNSGLVEGAGRAITLSGAGSTILNSGTMTSSSNIGISATQSDALTLTNSGLIESQSHALFLSGNGMRVANSGTLVSAIGDGVQASGVNFSLRNSGVIDSGRDGVAYIAQVDGGRSLHLTNTATGLIQGEDTGITVIYNDDAIGGERVLIQNAGEIIGRNAGVLSSNLPVTLLNSGHITATLGIAVQVQGEQNARIVNSGLIEAVLPVNLGPATAIDLKGAFGGGNGTLRNLGTILGDVQMGDLADTVRNAGLIDGDLRLDAGNDAFDGRGGQVTGQVLAGAGNDALLGGDAACDYVGGAGNDSITGGAANDTLRGNDGTDLVTGGAGDDLIQGGTGRDTMTGGTGRDVFLFASAAEVSVANKFDRITDFQSGQDRLDFNFGPGAKTYIGAADFTGQAGQIRSVAGTVEGDMNGDKLADFTLILENLPSLTAGDLVL